MVVIKIIKESFLKVKLKCENFKKFFGWKCEEG